MRYKNIEMGLVLFFLLIFLLISLRNTSLTNFISGKTSDNLLIASPSSLNLITGAPVGTLGVKILSSVTITLPVDTVNFSAMYPNDVDDTTDNDPPPFQLKNDGSVYVDITIEATDIFHGTNASNPSQYYQFLTDSSNDGPGSPTVWTNVASVNSSILAVDALDFTDQGDKDLATIEMKLSIPSDEPAGDKSSLITFTASEDS